MDVLIIGCGGREHAIALKLKESKLLKNLYCYGTYENPGIESLCSGYYIGYSTSINSLEKSAIDFLKRKFDIVVIGPEQYLIGGMADFLDLNCIGPYKHYAQIETSKSYCRELMKRHHIPGNIGYKYFHYYLNMKEIENYIRFRTDYVIKPDGLTGGKGVKVYGTHLHSYKNAMDYISSLPDGFLIEDKMVGEEFSLMSFCDGKTIKHMPLVKDHKRAFEGDEGGNTGGMGCYTGNNGLLPGITPNPAG